MSKGRDIVAIPLMTREKPPAYTPHDQLFKKLIKTFFKEFMEAFFPEVHDEIDFQAIKPISEAVYTDVLKGKERRLDIVIETKLREYRCCHYCTYRA